jgi:hypothetical protein
MKDTIKKKLESLIEEKKKGEQRLFDLQNEANNVQATVLRISGAIQILGDIDSIELKKNKKG